MKIAKEFKWEMGHRLTFHKGACKNLHGHSYKMIVELSGDTDKDGIVMDYYDLEKLFHPIIDQLDHSFLIYKEDKELINSLEKLGSRYTVINNQTTAENICSYFLEKIKTTGLPSTISKVKVRLFETDDAYAEDEIEF